MIQAEFDNLLLRMFDEPLDEGERNRLIDSLRGDASCVDRYLAHSRLHAMLRLQIRGEMALAEPPGVELPARESDVIAPIKASYWQRYRLTVSLSAALAFVVVGLSLMAIFRAPQFIANSLPANDGGAAQAPVEGVARVVRLEDAAFAREKDAFRAGQKLLAGDALRVQAGLVEIAFHNGAVAVLEGPADFRIVDGEEGFLSAGRLVAKVPQSAAGFAVATPSVRVVDLGTEFGVEVDGECVDVAVFHGQVAVYTLGESEEGRADSSAEATPLDEEPRVLSANEGVRVDRATGEAAPLDSATGEKFARGRAWGRTWDANRGVRTLIDGKFALIHNGQEGEPPKLHELNGQIVVVNGGHRNSNAGLASAKTFGAADAPDGMRLRFVVHSMTSHPMLNGMRLGLKTGGTDFAFNDDSSRYFWVQIGGRNLNVLRTGVEMRSAQGVANLYTGTSGEVHHNASGAWTDGFVAEIVLAPRGWRYEITGLNDASGKPAAFAQSGAWPEGITYADFLDGEFSVFSMVQQEHFPIPSNTGIITHRYGRVNAVALPPVAED